MGFATFVPDEAEINEAEGRFMLIPQDRLESFLAHPFTNALFLRDYCIPFFQGNSEVACKSVLNNLVS
eukprot:4141390-Lingulodinium_polyedra.AAC.1